MGEFISKNILITGGRFFTALELARSFYNSGHKVFVADTTRVHLCAYSKCVSRSFLIPSPRFEFGKFEKKLKVIIEKYNIDMVIPVFEEALYLAKADPDIFKRCELFCSSLSIMHQLHNKWLFSKLQDTLDIPILPIKLIKKSKDLKNIHFSPYALKPCYSRGSFELQKISSKEKPNISIDKAKKYWVAQKWIEGEKYCTYSICRNGKVQAHVTYPNKTICGYCMSFESIKHSRILQWVKNLVKKLNFTGQISLDLIESSDGSLYALECNPRATSGLHLLAANLDLAKYFIENNIKIYQSPVGVGRQMAFGMLLYGLNQREKKQTISSFVKKHLKYKDVVFCKEDLKPFLLQLFIFGKHILRCFKYKLPIPEAFLYDLNWEEEL